MLPNWGQKGAEGERVFLLFCLHTAIHFVLMKWDWVFLKVQSFDCCTSFGIIKSLPRRRLCWDSLENREQSYIKLTETCEMCTSRLRESFSLSPSSSCSAAS